jgi:hypothetical protein
MISHDLCSVCKALDGRLDGLGVIQSVDLIEQTSILVKLGVVCNEAV